MPIKDKSIKLFLCKYKNKILVPLTALISTTITYHFLLFLGPNWRSLEKVGNVRPPNGRLQHCGLFGRRSYPHPGLALLRLPSGHSCGL